MPVSRIILVLLDRDAPVDAVFLGWIVARRLVVRAAVVPDDDVALAPLVAVLAAGLDHVAGQLVDQLVALPRLHALDAQDLARIEVEALAPRLRMRADDRVEDGCPVTVLLVEEGGGLAAAPVREGSLPPLQALLQPGPQRLEARVVELPDVDSVDLRAYLRPQAANLDHRYVLLSWSQRTQQNRLT